ncbi:MAG: NAD(P)-dependent oxidoreductase [Dehalococcoidia bacterium]|nr:NAD(P)-dependent oxidoreductase [Dehalococcoidia bacterium]
MKVLITGGGGFIGRNLKEQLGSGFQVEAPSHLELDLLDEDAVQSYLSVGCFDAVMHTATENATRNAKRDVTKVLHNNCRMFFNLARCCDKFGKMIYFGSGAEYDARYYRAKMDENYFDSHIPVDDYGFSKYIMAKHIDNCQNIFDLRLFGVFGKYEDWQIRFISNACCKAVWDLPITIRQNVVFDYLWVDDLVNITKWFICSEPKHRHYNVCAGRTYDLRTLAEKVLAVSGKNLDVVIARAGLGKEYSGDNSLLLAEMGEYPFRDMDSCIRDLYGWYANKKQEIDPLELLAEHYR